MRLLEFDVDKQRLKKADKCDFTGLISGTEGYLHTKFTFSDEWEGCKKIASFWSYDIFEGSGQEEAVFLNDDDMCVIPADALKGERFYISVIGVKPGYKITTNKIKIEQEVD